MGCVSTKPGSCWYLAVEEDSVLKSSNSTECFNDIQTPFPIKETLVPSFEPSPFDYPFFPISTELLDKDFPVFNYSSKELVQYAMEMLKQFDTNSRCLFTLLDLIRNNYFSFVPFHNFWHGFSVAQILFSVGERNEKYTRYLHGKEYFYLLLSGLGHDLCHPGVNNSFLIGTRNELAVKYNNESVLENHHVSVLIRLVEKSQIMTDMEFEYARKIFLECILSTDMAKHKETEEKFENTMQSYSVKNRQHRVNFMSYILHSADIGNQSVNFPLAVLWSLRLCREFNQQCSQEEKIGITISEHLRLGRDVTKIKNSQVGFIKSIILPMWVSLSNHLDNLDDHIRTLQQNQKKWAELKNFETFS